MKKTIFRYYALAVFIMIAGSVAVTIFSAMANGLPIISSMFADMGENEVKTIVSTSIKLPVDMLLFLISYNVQKKYVFRKDEQ